MVRRPLTRAALFLVGFGLMSAAPAAALDVRVTELRAAGGTVRANLDVRDVFPQKFKDALETGGSIHLRLQIELWQDRPIWDKLVQPALVTVLRIVLDPGTRQVTVSDQYGEINRQPAWQEPVALHVDVARADAIADGSRYYVRVLATLGTLAEREAEQASDAVFGRDDGSVSLGTVGRMLFHAVLQVSDYLQSVSTEIRTRDLGGRELKTGVRP
ncbi:MAG: hypothetical protein DMF85_19550 [Acidobacteria bacterium]|nr:MAG: hypothetical protein DMF85_19550 [Acidobacteriota bacterium]PYR80408.1 MAG: hypothetical protein DMF86_00845 [Acidobacteriota bacterium]